MEENKQGYDPSEFEDDDYMTPQPDAGKSIRGYRIVIIILSVILVALSALYFSIHRQQMIDNRLLQSDRDSIQNDLGRLMTDFDNLQVTNDSISAGLTIERDRADSLMTRLKKERSWNLAKIKQYEKEVGTLRTIMKGYIRQIDSLNTLNKKLISENVGYRKEISSAKLRAEMAEEKAADLARRLRADHRSHADLRFRGRTPELFGHARSGLPESGPRRGHLLQQHRIRRRHLHRAALLRRPPDRHLANRHALTAAPVSGNPPDPGCNPHEHMNSRSS